MRISALAISLFVLQPIFPQASSDIDHILDSLSSVHELHGPSLSRDGKLVAWVEASRGKDKAGSRHSAIYVRDLRDATSQSRRVGESTSSEHSPAWSKEGKPAFLSEAGPRERCQADSHAHLLYAPPGNLVPG